MKTVENGDIVEVSYTAMLEDRRVIDTTDEEVARNSGVLVPGRNYAPFAVEVGAGKLIKGLERALIGMQEEEEKEVLIPPEEAYGLRDPNLLKVAPRSMFEQHGIQPVKGMNIQTKAGIAWVAGVREDEVELDFNHPLAGEMLLLDITVETIRKG